VQKVKRKKKKYMILDELFYNKEILLFIIICVNIFHKRGKHEN